MKPEGRAIWGRKRCGRWHGDWHRLDQSIATHMYENALRKRILLLLKHVQERVPFFSSLLQRLQHVIIYGKIAEKTCALHGTDCKCWSKQMQETWWRNAKGGKPGTSKEGQAVSVSIHNNTQWLPSTFLSDLGQLLVTSLIMDLSNLLLCPHHV